MMNIFIGCPWNERYTFGSPSGKVYSPTLAWKFNGSTAAKVLPQRNNLQEACDKTNVKVLLAAIKATRNLERGKQLHAEAVECGHDCNIYVTNALINMYAKCGSMMDAREVFDVMTHRTVVSWSVLILGYADNGRGHTALEMFCRMRSEGLEPDSVTLVGALKACTSLAGKEEASRLTECKDRAKGIHNISVDGCKPEIQVQNSLMDMYSKCNSMIDARDVFDGIEHPTVVSYNVLILGYANNREGHLALDMFSRMTTEGLAPNSLTMVASVKACNSLAVKEGDSRWMECMNRCREIHRFAVDYGCDSNVYVRNSLIDLYARCGCMVLSREVFDFMKHSNVESWNALILGYADNGQGHTALDMFTKMRLEDVAPNPVTVVAALKACTCIAEKEGAKCLERARKLHNIALCNSDVYVESALVNMYAKCGSIADARAVFDNIKHPNVVSWTSMILGYADDGQGHTALDMFNWMRTEGHAPNCVTLVAVIKACTSIAENDGVSRWAECRNMGEEIHSLAIQTGCNSNIYIYSSLIDLYGKCGSMEDARKVFDGINRADVGSWNALISGYAVNGQGHTALDMFMKMRNKGPAPDCVTFGAALKACGVVGALEFGRTIHSELDRGIELDVVLVCCLVDFYGKCGSLVEAQHVFNLHPESRNVVTWTALLAGFSSYGDNEAVFELFEKMQDAGVQPNGVTFICVLTCCSRAGLIEKGKECFYSMSTKYGIIPSIEHYNCMIDLFRRGNKLDDAKALMDCMPFSPDDVTWTTIIGASRK